MLSLRNTALTTALAVSIAVAATASPAFAQETAESVFDPLDELDPSSEYFIDLESAASGPRPAVPRPIEGSAGAAVLANSNLFATAENPTGALGVEVTPALRFRQAGPTLRLDGRIAGRARLYADHSTENLFTLDSGFDARWRATSDLTVSGSAFAGRFVEDRAAAFAPVDVRKPVRYERFGGTVAAQYTPGRLVFAPFAVVERSVYHDERRRSDPTLVSVQSRRNLVHLTPGLIAGYRSPGGTIVYAGIEGDWRYYDEDPTKDSSGYAAYGGIRLNAHRLVALRAELGYREQNYDAPLASPSGLLARASVEWVPNPLTLVRISYRRDISETGALAIGGAKRQTVEVNLDRTLTRALALGFKLRAQRSDAAAGVQRADRLTAMFEARYLLTARHELFASVEPLLSRNSGVLSTGQDFERVIALAGIRLQFH